MTEPSTELQLGVGLMFWLVGVAVFAAALRLVPEGFWRKPKRRLAREKPGRTSVRGARGRRTVRSTLLNYASWIVFLWVFFAARFWTARSVGITRSDSPVLALLAGAMIYYAMLTAYGAVLHVFGLRKAQQLAGLRVGFGMLPTRAHARCIVIAAICIVNPVVEEIVFRGMLVHQYAAVSGHFARALILGAVVNTVNHAYQGCRFGPFHLCFYAGAVGLMYSPYGLVAAIGFHFAGDALPLLGLQSQLVRYRQARRAARHAGRAALG